MRMGRFKIEHSLHTSLWVIPFACAVAGILLSLATVWIDRSVGDTFVPRVVTGDPNAALIILSTVAASMVSLTALVLTITSVVVQLAMGQFSPRSVRPFLQDRPSQLAIGVFVGTFAHAMFAMRDVRSTGQAATVPGVTILTSYVLVFVSVVVLVAYVHHIANSLKVDSIIKSVADETRALFDKLCPDGRGPTTARDVASTQIASDRAGFVFHIDHDRLVEAASDRGVCLELLRGVGDFVPEGAPIVTIHGAEAADVDEGAIRPCILIGAERTMDQDGAFGVQTLVDIAERSLGEDYSDQTTAAQVVERLYDLMRSLADRPLPSGRFEDRAGTLRVIVPVPQWDDYVGIAFDGLIMSAEGSPLVLSRIGAVLEALLGVARPDRRPAIHARLERLRIGGGTSDAAARATDPAA